MMNYVTVIVPVLNEEKYIRRFLRSLLRQDYPRDRMEVLFLDGGCRDETVGIITKQWRKVCAPSFCILENKGRIAACAMNIGIAEAAGDIIVRMDAHMVYPSNYISMCVHYLTTTDADNVGCPLIQRGNGLIGDCIEKVLTSSFGVGGSSYRIGNAFYSEKTEYVDTVPLGTFKKELALRLGGFDDRYPRAEDNDFNYRIRKAGGKVLLFKEIHTVYYCRSSVSELIRMGYGNGESIGRVFWKDTRTVGIRHMVPLFFVLSLAGGAIFSRKNHVIRYLQKAEKWAYGLSCLIAALHSRIDALKTLLVFFLFPVLHISYGVGTVIGLVKGFVKKVIGNRHDGH